MAEMTASEAKDLLTAKADIPQDIKDSPFFNLYLRISVENARRIAALIEQQQQQVEALKCCGNCKDYLSNNGNCGLPNSKDLKCDKWQGVEQNG